MELECAHIEYAKSAALDPGERCDCRPAPPLKLIQPGKSCRVGQEMSVSGAKEGVENASAENEQNQAL